MMLLFSLVFALSCPEIKIINRTSEWTQNDQNVFDNVKNRCKSVYPDSPCLKVFEKTAAQAYSVTCGKEE